MRFTEFKESKYNLSETDWIVLEYCMGDITKEDAVKFINEVALGKANVVKIREMTPAQKAQVDKLTKQNIAKGKSTSQGGTGSFFDRMAAGFRKMGSKVTGGFIDSPEQQARQDATASVKKASRPKTGQMSRGRVPFRRGTAQAQDKTPPPATKPFKGPQVDDFKDMPKTFTGPQVDDFADMPKTFTGPQVDDFKDMPGVKKAAPAAPAKRGKVKATAANTANFDKTMALQKRLKAAGAKIDADGIMGPKTRAAMKKFGRSAGASLAGDMLSRAADMPSKFPNIARAARADISGGTDDEFKPVAPPPPPGAKAKAPAKPAAKKDDRYKL